MIPTSSNGFVGCGLQYVQTGVRVESKTIVNVLQLFNNAINTYGVRVPLCLMNADNSTSLEFIYCD